ncbi:MAG: membrane protein insertion efficiency factor YidD [Bacteriovoracaceae bacterium]|nr:membrane protein insertion efficiency factor YidD [Bacteriovoracaceae bacterium]
MKLLVIQLIKLYKTLFSPFLGKNCRFHPSCSSYCLECFERLSFFKALWYSIRRISKCHPFHPGGYDPLEK